MKTLLEKRAISQAVASLPLTVDTNSYDKGLYIAPGPVDA